MARHRPPLKHLAQQDGGPGYQSIWMLILTATSRELTLLSLTPVYGSPNVHGSHGLTFDIGMLLLPWTMLHLFCAAGSFTLVRLTLSASILGCLVPSIVSYLQRYSGSLGPEWGPLLSVLLTTVPLTFVSSLHAAYSMVQQKAYVRTLGPSVKNQFFPYAIAYFLVLAFQMIAHQLIHGIAGSVMMYLGRHGLQAVLTGLFAALDRSRSLLVTIPLVCFAALNMHVPFRSNLGRLNANLEAEGYATIDRKESITGYISVLDNLKDGFRVLRCDHSLLGGEWIRQFSSYTPKLKEPIYAIFIMLEAVRLVKSETTESLVKEADYQKQALFIGLGIGTSPAAFISHGIATTIIELDPVIHEFATRYFSLPATHTSIIGDAIVAIEDMRREHTSRYDYIIHDVFTGGTEPIELFTKDFLTALSSLLNTDGTIAINYAGDLLLPSAAAVVNTVLAVFPTCRFFREMAKPSSTATEDLTNMVMFCRKTTEPFTFRRPTEADYLLSQARKEHLFPRHEVDLREFNGRSGEIITQASMTTLRASQKQSALSHWYLMRNVIPDKPVFRRASTTSSAKSDLSSSSTSSALGTDRSWGKGSLRLGKTKKAPLFIPVNEEKELPAPPTLPETPTRILETQRTEPSQTPSTSLQSPEETPLEKENPRVVIEQATPENRGRPAPEPDAGESPPKNSEQLGEPDAARPSLAARRHTPISLAQSRLFSPPRIEEPAARKPQSRSHLKNRSQAFASMQHRKIWVKRPNGVPTQVPINEDDLVDDVKDMILRKYANSLGKNFDPPDVTLKVGLGPHSSRHTNEKNLVPDENISKILDMHYPGGQSIDEALIIDVPQRRTPKHSPRVAVPYYLTDDLRPGEHAGDYFPPMPVNGPHSPLQTSNLSVSSGHGGIHRPPPHPHSISVIETDQVPNLPSPGGGGAGGAGRVRHADRAARPKYGRQHTSSPTILGSSNHNQNHDLHRSPNAPAIPTPPVPSEIIPRHTATPPPPRLASPRPLGKAKRSKKDAINGDGPSTTPAGLLDGGVPPINVLIVEDNIINLKLLEAFLKRLKVRWSTAMNGEIAVNKWREGGFHLVLMDIQLPVMNGLDATKEIRRLERVNNIGVFSSSSSASSSTPTFEEKTEGVVNGNREGEGVNGENLQKLKEVDNLMNTALFKSPVIIVALTASSLQSDRHEALAAGCNDFLTKPVNFDWLSRKVMEWGCMQALIDFDGWRKWKDFSSTKPLADGSTTTPNKQAANSGVARSENSPLVNAKVKKMLGALDGGTSSSGDGGGGSSGEGG
ncbi:MAG: hypothetical protein Q9217_002874 [Psora testacea]